MDPDNVPPNILAFHAEYEKLAGVKLTLNFTRLDMWRQFLAFRKPPFTIRDLIRVVLHLRQEIRNGTRNPGALKFRNLIGSPDYFEEDLTGIIARGRRSEPLPRRSVTVNGSTRIMPPDPAGKEAVAIAVPLDLLFKQMREAAK